MIARADRTRRATLRAVRLMLALRLVGRELADPAGPTASLHEGEAPAPKKSNNRRGVINSGKGAASSKRIRCEGEAPEGTSGAATVGMKVSANASQARPTIQDPEPVRIPRAERISLADAPSGMELAAERWRSPVAAGEEARRIAARQAAEGRAFCKCGGDGKEGGYVPAWFGRDCIEKDCQLRGHNVR